MRRRVRPSLPMAKQLRWQGQLPALLSPDRHGLLIDPYAQPDKHLRDLQLGHRFRSDRQVTRRYVQGDASH